MTDCRTCDGEGSVYMHRDGTWHECGDCNGFGRDQSDGPSEQQISDAVNAYPPSEFTMLDKDDPR